MEVNIDAKVHSMIIGRGGKSIRNIMEKFKVDIRLPRAGDEDPTLVVVSGDQEACEECIDYLKIMEEYLSQKDHTFKAKLKWSDEYGGHGEHYYDINHVSAYKEPVHHEPAYAPPKPAYDAGRR